MTQNKNIICAVLAVVFCFVTTAAPLAQSLSNTTLQQQSNSPLANPNSMPTDLSGNQNIQQTLIRQNAASKFLNASEQQIHVHILGDVQNPGIYALNLTDRLTDALAMVVPNRAKTLRLVQVRNQDSNNATTNKTYDLYQYYYNGKLDQNPYLSENDVIFVPQSNGMIRVDGAVKRNGTFELSWEKTLNDAIKLAGGSTSLATKNTPIRVIRVQPDGKQNVDEVTWSNKAWRGYRIQAGDIIVVPDVMSTDNKFDYSIDALPGENQFLPTAKPQVYVAGAVAQPGILPYRKSFAIKDYVGQAGVTDSAKLRYAKVIRQGKTLRMSLDSKVDPGDMIIIRKKDLSTVTTIIGLVSSVLSVTLTTVVLSDKLNK